MLVYHRLSLDAEPKRVDDFKKHFPARKSSSSQKNILKVDEEPDQRDLNLDFIYNNTHCPEYMRQIIEAEMKLEESKAKTRVSQTTQRLGCHKVYYKLEVKIVKIEINQTFA